SIVCLPMLLDDESTGEPEPADTELSLLPRSLSGTAPPSDLEERYPLTLDDRGEKGSEEGLATLPQVQESIAGLPILLDDKGNNGYKLADASLSI
ncbi:hypothetical protein C8A01DRAFT_21326, partial [Parachaetomium inaequale]